VPGFTTGDGLETYFGDDRLGGYGDFDLWMMKRETIGADWCQPVNLGPVVNSSAGEVSPTISMDGLELYFSNREAVPRPGTYGSADLWVTRRPTRNDPWGTPVNLGPTINTPYREHFPVISADGLSLFFYSTRPSGYGGWDLYMTRRSSRSDPWGPPVNLGPLVNSPGGESQGYMSVDGSTFCFHSNRPGGYGGHDCWQVSIFPIVDFNGDGKVDGKEVLVMAECWGENEPLCDIGPTPMGDGIVDAKDLKVLAEYIGKEVVDPTLVVHWALDETAGALAKDSAGENDGLTVGNPVWQPAGGKVGGALQFDGKDDVVITQPIPGLDKGTLAVFAWIKGGTPGQVVLYHSKGAKWLYLNPIDGSLATELRSPIRSALPLLSEAVITDGKWHRIGVVWDGKYRILYADDKEVARDTQPEVTISDGGFIMGAGTTPGTLWSGLIDDVRVYNRVVKP